MQYIIGASSIWTSSKEVWAAIYDYPLFFLGGRVERDLGCTRVGKSPIMSGGFKKKVVSWMR
ncbi:hypothetical protein COCCADRAFT_111877 [Bipolaris zeicola 26-R-13]|uniref:Uncharacterized protein n=1 Tax=Cochliobolus carbonum (strain 26-R-13) TaxID=930089 RepID=W6XXB5_COCC2|nr:uncharacterized protein COCCADRAFT_111877 [Bipolaris zeicola 26-R-13]EUC27374.1 hypothetical protein COCCADRAFT_111877 [Bipolaris zeicola 26-R-13]